MFITGLFRLTALKMFISILFRLTLSKRLFRVYSGWPSKNVYSGFIQVDSSNNVYSAFLKVDSSNNVYSAVLKVDTLPATSERGERTMRGYKLMEKEAEEVVKCVKYNNEEDVVRQLLKNDRDAREICTIIVRDGTTALHAMAQFPRPQILQVNREAGFKVICVKTCLQLIQTIISYTI